MGNGSTCLLTSAFLTLHCVLPPQGYQVSRRPSTGLVLGSAGMLWDQLQGPAVKWGAQCWHSYLWKCCVAGHIPPTMTPTSCPLPVVGLNPFCGAGKAPSCPHSLKGAAGNVFAFLHRSPRHLLSWPICKAGSLKLRKGLLESSSSCWLGKQVTNNLGGGGQRAQLSWQVTLVHSDGSSSDPGTRLTSVTVSMCQAAWDQPRFASPSRLLNLVQDGHI